MSQEHEEQIDTDWVICPYCKSKHQRESEDWSEDSRVERCHDCGKLYHTHDEISVTHVAKPDCELNGEEYAWRVGSTVKAWFCSKCGACSIKRPASLEAIDRAELSPADVGTTAEYVEVRD